MKSKQYPNERLHPKDHLQKKRAVYYTRVSHENQVEDGSSLDNQEDRIEAFCKLNNYEIVATFSDPGVSGRKFENRPEFMKMIEMVKRKEVDVVVVYSLSRFGRNTKDTLKWVAFLENFGVSFYTLDFQFDTSTSHGKLMLQMIAAFAEFESNQRGELISSVMKYLKKENKVYCGPTPLGFDKNDGNLVVNETEMKVVRQIFTWEKHINYSEIARLLNKDGFATKNGKQFHHSTIIKIVNNNIYEQFI
jgi:DNA invertase Pin-like site-specific DNA recombinase